MTDIIERLYDDISMDGYTVSKELRELYRQMDALLKSVQPLLGPEVVEKLQSCQACIEREATQEWFREGIRVGFSLVLEAF